jgi:hypothetical protein
MHALRLFQEGPNTELSWMIYGLLGLFIIVIIVGSLTHRGKDQPQPRQAPETRQTPRKTRGSVSRKKTKKLN